MSRINQILAALKWDTSVTIRPAAFSEGSYTYFDGPEREEIYRTLGIIVEEEHPTFQWYRHWIDAIRVRRVAEA